MGRTVDMREELRILVCFDDSLTEEEKLRVRRCVPELKEIFPGSRPLCVGRSRWGGVLPDKLTEKTENDQGLCFASEILRRMYKARLCEREVWAAVFFTGRDLYLSGLPWCFGAASTPRRVCVQSLVRYRGLDERERLACIRRTLRHELGHVFGMAADPRRPETVADKGMHCTVPGCSMRQTGTLRALLATAAEEEAKGQYFCPRCRADYAGTLERFCLHPPVSADPLPRDDKTAR